MESELKSVYKYWRHWLRVHRQAAKYPVVARDEARLRREIMFRLTRRARYRSTTS